MNLIINHIFEYLANKREIGYWSIIRALLFSNGSASVVLKASGEKTVSIGVVRRCVDVLWQQSLQDC